MYRTTTLTHAEDELSFTRPLGAFAVKGKSEAADLVEIFTTDAAPLREAKRASRPALARALAFYNEGALVEALTIVGELAESSPHDGPVQWWFGRMQQGLASDGPPSERGIVRLTDK